MITNLPAVLLFDTAALAPADWWVLGATLLLIVAIGLSMARKGGKDLSSFFLGGRNLPWYIAGVSMVATTFAADTPLAVTELVATKGIAGNWLWWNFLLGGMLTTFFFARLWRKAGVLTEVELIELRYAGKPAAFLRAFKSVYLGLFLNVLIIGWVNLAMITILEVFFGVPFQTAFWMTGGLVLLVALYSATSGLLGIAITDAIQFVIAMTGCIILAVLVVQSDQVGSLPELKAQLDATMPGVTSFFPSITSGGNNTTGIASTLGLGFGAFLAYIGIQWWASWYPGAEPGGGGYVAQRMMSAKNERHAVYATLFFQIAHYCIRPWPWIVVALCCLTLYGNYLDRIPAKDLRMEAARVTSKVAQPPRVLLLEEDELRKMATSIPAVAVHLEELLATRQAVIAAAESEPELQKSLDFWKDPRKGYVFAMKDFLPMGLKGLMLAAFFAAFMSTISTQLNWGASYVVNDLYKRFLARRLDDHHLVQMSRLTTMLLMAIGLSATLFMGSITGVWHFLIECGAGLGLVLILRWYWWRINAWSEITATIAPFIGYALGRYVFDWVFPGSFFFTVAFTTVAWMVVTYFTKPEPQQHLAAFYRKVQPGGAWKPITSAMSETFETPRWKPLLFCWLAGVVLVYSVLFGLGHWLMGETVRAAVYGVAVLAAWYVLRKYLPHSRILK